ncbi:hypothetical protein OU792_16930 [Algoriphagus sp. NF]|uniref:Uncharacterized protein n=1 Tax=Algoriphagus marincola TaxID=264027 RepID=A0ABS7N1A7_9BACT|nr:MULTISPECIES: hypothetical protein [Algoriphagus]MBY5950116.1 hypothetical protein [Algoriphagus marincola]MCR9082012.1 hypothetical protein [Cyclobacteriaceae bacterium]MDE0561685.1 hypothetical protein [Algoriphagus sp. NF]
MKELKIKDLIKELKKAKKKGAKNLQFKGTLMVSELGNNIIVSTEPQW